MYFRSGANRVSDGLVEFEERNSTRYGFKSQSIGGIFRNKLRKRRPADGNIRTAKR